MEVVPLMVGPLPVLVPVSPYRTGYFYVHVRERGARAWAVKNRPRYQVLPQRWFRRHAFRYCFFRMWAIPWWAKFPLFSRTIIGVLPRRHGYV